MEVLHAVKFDFSMYVFPTFPAVCEIIQFVEFPSLLILFCTFGDFLVEPAFFQTIAIVPSSWSFFY